MKKVLLLLTVIAICFTSYGQGGAKPLDANATMNPNYGRGNINLLQKACENTLNISTPTNWVPVGGVPTTVTTFYNHSNWLDITNAASNKTYQFRRLFYVGRAGVYKINVRGMGDNRMILTVDTAPIVFDKDVTVANQFNTPASANVDVNLECGIHYLNVSISNYTGPSGFYLDGSITSKDGCVSDDKVVCEVFKEVCRCPEGWLSNDSPYSKDFRCSKMLCNLEIKPLPKNDTRIGDWGFTWGNGIWVFGTKENGGAPICKKEWVVESTNSNTKPSDGRGEK